VLADLLIEDAAELLTLDGPPGPRAGPAQSELGLIQGGAVAARDGRIVAVGASAEVRARIELAPGARVYSAAGRVVMPGFVDPHTHLIFAGDRAAEFARRLAGASYLDVLAGGGGILDTVRQTRLASLDDLLAGARRRLRRMLAAGTTTVEMKSGYGLTVEDELKILRVAKALIGGVARTFMGAHAVPPEFRGRRQAYVDLVCEEMIPRVADEYLAEYCDVLCEKGAFSVEESRRILETGVEHGLKPKVHADEMVALGGAELAAELRAVSADHLSKTSEQGLRALAEAGTVAVLLPGTGLFLGHAARARRMVELGIPVALGTDFNPGTCPIESMAMIVGLACAQLGLSVAEAIVGATVNAAHAIGRGGRVGSLREGKQADLLVLDAPDHRHLAYRFGTNLVYQVFQNGGLAHQAAEPAGEI